ncbi:MAG: DUF6797 domain-containing protein, partial [Roseimicrobium sp.]
MLRTLTLVIALLLSPSFGQEIGSKPAPKTKKKPAKPVVDPIATEASKGHQWAPWVEPDFPFFSSVLDARDVGKGFPKDNLTPRGLILNLGHNVWACFDTDLLRISTVWSGKGVTPVALAPGSYHIAGQKTKDGQDDLPQPGPGAVGPWFANGLYQGWQILGSPDATPVFTDPRDPGPSHEEVGRGPLKADIGRFESVVVEQSDGKAGNAYPQSSVRLTYFVGDTRITESWEVLKDRDMRLLYRHFLIEPHASTLAVVFATKTNVDTGRLLVGVGMDAVSIKPYKNQIKEHADVHWLRIDASSTPQSLTIQYGGFPSLGFHRCTPLQPEQPAPRKAAPLWPQTLTTKAARSTKPNEAYVLDDIPLPLDNPWKRNLRLADIAFLDDQGHAAAVS